MEKSLSRTQTRENLIAAIYDNLILNGKDTDIDVVSTLLKIFHKSSLEDIDLFPKEIYLACYKNYDEIVTLVQSKLVKWTFSRLNNLAQALFLEVVAENVYAKLTTKKVLIDFAVDYAKKYLSSTDYRYINAVLDKILIDL